MRLAGQEIAVIGAGIGGLAAATALAQRGARVRVFEQAPRARRGRRRHADRRRTASPCSRRSASRDAAAAVRQPAAEAVELRDHRGGAPGRALPLGQPASPATAAPTGSSTAPTSSTLLAGAAAEAGVEIELGAAVEAVAPAAGRAPRSPTAATARPRSSWPPTALRSAIRAAHFAGAAAALHRPRRLARPGRRPSAPAGGLRRPATRVTMAPGRHLVTYPLRGGALVNLVAVEERAAWTAEGWMPPDDPGDLRRAFAGWGGAAGALLAAVEACFLWGLFDHPPLPALDRRAARAPRRRLPPDAALPRPRRHDGARGRLGPGRRARPRRRPARRPRRLRRRRGRPRATRVQRAAARSGRLYHLRPGPARAGARRASARSPAVAPALLARRFDWLFGGDVTTMSHAVARHTARHRGG